jgi:hypothetical protein
MRTQKYEKSKTEKVRRVWRKWASCRTRECHINVTDTYKDFFECSICEDYCIDGRKYKTGR